MSALPSLLTVKGLTDKYDYLTQGGIRYLIFHSPENGFDQCVVRIGRKILIEEQAFFHWLNGKNSNKLYLGKGLANE